METPRDPIAFILDEHERQFEICDRLENFVGTLESEPSGQEVQSLLAFLTEDLPVHIDDEERDLFPMLASRGYNDPNLNIILEQLAAEHELDRGLVEPILEELRRIAEDRAPSDSRRFCMEVRAFTEAMRRHINWENRVVVPLARAILSEDDRVRLARHMAERRGRLARGDT